MRLAPIAVVGLCVLVAGCGGVEREPNLARASERTTATGSFRGDVTLAGTDDVTGERVDYRCEVAVDLEAKRARYTCDPPDALEWIYVEGDTYFRIPGEKRWTVSRDSGPLGEEVSPEGFLELLTRASSETERIGEEEVRGVATVRYRLAVKCDEVGFDCPRGETLPTDVWIDDDGLVRRVRTEEKGATSTVEYFDFGAQLDIEPPPADQVTEYKDDPREPRPCASADARPISVAQALRTLRGHGFDVAQDTLGCPAGVTASLSNFGTDQGLDEGPLACHVLTEPDAPDPGQLFTMATIPNRRQLPPVERRLENLDCTLFRYEGQGDEPVERLDAALAELR